MSNKLLLDNLYFLLNEEQHGFGTELEKSEADPSRKPFFLENIMILRRKVRNLTVISSEDFFYRDHYVFGTKSQKSESITIKDFFFGEHNNFETNFVFFRESQTIFCPIHKVLHANCMFSLRGYCTPLTYS